MNDIKPVYVVGFPRETGIHQVNIYELKGDNTLLEEGMKLYPQSAVDALQAEVGRLRPAAERYWWLRDEATMYDGNGAETPRIVIGTDGGNARPLYGDDIDSMIDNILQEQG